jgi:hypothetical protein
MRDSPFDNFLTKITHTKYLLVKDKTQREQMCEYQVHKNV